MEGAEAGWATATGMAAVFTTLASILQSGDHVVSCRSVFGSSHILFTKVFPKWNINHTYVDANQQDDWEAAIQKNTKALFVETPSNPGIDIIDLEYLGKLAKKHGILLIVDNCFATSYIQKPIDFGAHIVVHSATKYMDGQGRVLGGVILGSKEIIDEVKAFARHSGPSLSPFNAWILSKSLETLALRMDRHSDNATKLSQFLEDHPNVEAVRYPFLPSHPQYEIARKQMTQGGGILSFIIKGGIEA
jgi:O-succinylhomoserine sulfhydrylase